MKNIVKLPFIIFLPILVLSNEVPFNSATLSYVVEKKVHTYQERVPLLNILKEEKSSSAVTVVKSSQKHYVQDKLEVEFTVVVTLHRDVTDLTISDNIVQGFHYKDASLRLNNQLPQEFKILDSAITIPIGDVKGGYSYTMSYIAKPSLSFHLKI